MHRPQDIVFAALTVRVAALTCEQPPLKCQVASRPPHRVSGNGAGQPSTPADGRLCFCLIRQDAVEPREPAHTRLPLSCKIVLTAQTALNFSYRILVTGGGRGLNEPPSESRRKQDNEAPLGIDIVKVTKKPMAKPTMNGQVLGCLAMRTTSTFA